ncbi:MAG TPA: hypothetical protein PK776_03545 [Flavobacterium sp.]|nr:hypothetical protein [Flavobacterium sp.]
MTFLHIFTEEPSLKIVLDTILPKILPDNVYFQIYSHQGKQDLEKALISTLPTISKIHGSKILVTRDQDSSDCKELKQNLLQIIGLNCHCDFLVRIVCRELESWYLGDMQAIEKAYPRFKSEQYRNKAEYRNVDKLQSPNRELLKIIPEYSNRDYLPKLETAEYISPFLNLKANNSESFNQTINAILKLIN